MRASDLHSVQAPVLTPIRLQVYAQLKRLGYILVRSRVIPTRTPRSKKTAVAPRSTVQLLRIPLDTLHHALLRLFRSLLAIPRSFLSKPIILRATRVLKKGEGRLRSLIGAGRWTSYGKGLPYLSYCVHR